MDGTVVVLLPAGKLFEPVYGEAIMPVAAEAGREVVRLSIQFNEEAVRTRLIDGLKSAELVIADVTGRNPNVMYGVGVADAIEKKVLLLVQHLEDLPFEKQAREVIAYAGDRQFLKTELAGYFRGETKSAEPSANSARERFQEIFGEILTRHGYVHRGEIEMENPATFVLLNQEMELALVQDLARKARELGMRLKLM
jgi:hypothetical protein